MGFVQAHNSIAPPFSLLKGEEPASVITMIGTLINDAEKDGRDMQEAALDEKDAQSNYEKFMTDAGNKHAEYFKSMSDDQSCRAPGVPSQPATRSSWITEVRAHGDRQMHGQASRR